MSELSKFDYAELDTEARIVVQQKTGEIHERVEAMKRSAIEIGQRLIEVKSKLPYGFWGKWLDAEFGWTDQVAINFMAIAHMNEKNPRFLESEARFAKHALIALAAKTVPDSARDEAIDRAEQGEHIGVKDADQIIAEHQPSPLLTNRGFSAGQRVYFRNALCIVEQSNPNGTLNLRAIVGAWRKPQVPQADVLLITEQMALNRQKPTALQPAPVMESFPAIVEPPASETQPYDITDPTHNPQAESHPHWGVSGYPAICPNCGETHYKWKALPGGFWKCQLCGEAVRDDAMEVETPEDRAAVERMAGRRNGRQKPKNNSTGDHAEGEPDPRDKCQTPDYAIDPLLRHLRKDWVIYEPAYGDGMLADALYDGGIKTLISGDLLTGQDFLKDGSKEAWDCLVTNPPYSAKYDWLAKCYALGKPFALLMPIDTLGSKTAQDLFGKCGIEVIFMNQRIDFKMPEKGWKGSGAQFSSAWFCWQLEIGREMTFADITDAKEAFKNDLREAGEID